MGDDLAHPPRPQPHLAHLGLAESVDGGSQLRVFLLGRLDDIVLRFHRAPPVVGFALLLPGHRWASPVKHGIERLALNGLMPLKRGGATGRSARSAPVGRYFLVAAAGAGSLFIVSPGFFGLSPGLARARFAVIFSLIFSHVP